MTVEVPQGIAVGHWTDRVGWTGATVILGPPDAVSAGEVRGGGPGTREFDLLSPATAQPGAQALVLAGGSAFGLGVADGVLEWMSARGLGYETRAARVPLVTAAVVYDLGIGDPRARPGADAGRLACEAAGRVVERGSVGAGTGCTAGKALAGEGATKTGLGAASLRVGDALLTAIAVANPFGDVIGPDGAVMAGVWRDGGWRRTVDIVREARTPLRPRREATTLVALLTDATLTKAQAWLTARAGSAGVARAVQPCATAFDGDLVMCMATGRVAADPVVLSVLAAEVTSAAIRDAAVAATGAPGWPSAAERAASVSGRGPVH